MSNLQGQAIREIGETDIPAFTQAQHDHLAARFGQFKQNQSPRSLDEVITISHAASEQIGALKVLDYIATLIGRQEQPKVSSMDHQTAAFEHPESNSPNGLK